MMFFQASSASLLTLTPHFPFLCLSFYLQLSLLSEIHSWSIWDQLINFSVTEYFTSYLSKIPGLLLLYLLGHYQSVLEAPSSQLCCSQLNLPDPYLSLICLMSECSELFSIVKYCITHFFFKIENWHGFLLDKARPPCMTMESILWSSTTLVLCGPQTFYANSHIHQITVTWICFIRKLCFHMSKNIYT